MKRKFEYRVEQVAFADRRERDDAILKLLNRQGAEGWRLSSLSLPRSNADEHTVEVFLEREVDVPGWAVSSSA